MCSPSVGEEMAICESSGGEETAICESRGRVETTIERLQALQQAQEAVIDAEKAAFDRLDAVGNSEPRWLQLWRRAQAEEAWTVEFDLFVKGLQDEEGCQLDRFELEHKTVKEVDELGERAVDVWRKRA